jgi:predicted DNA-binding transcriptional regulator AlpA
VSEIQQQDVVIWRRELPAKLGVTSEAVRKMMKAGKLPKPDVDLSQKTRGWRMSTLHAAGIKLV